MNATDKSSSAGDAEAPLLGVDLGKQQRNLLLMQPLFALALRMRHADAGGAVWADLDVHYLSLCTLLYIMDGATLGKGRTLQEVVYHVAEVVRRMKPRLSDAESTDVAREVLDALHNAENKTQKFSYTYYDGNTGARHAHSFLLLRYERSDEDDAYYFRVSDEGFVVYLGMLDFGAATMQALMEKMLLDFIRRGNIDQALEASQRALYEGRRYSEQIGTQLLRAQRLPDVVRWKEDLSPRLQAAREHLDARVGEEHQLLQATQDSLNTARDTATRYKFARLHDSVNSGLVTNTRLLQVVSDAGDRYRKAARTLFRARRRGRLPNLEDLVLPELLQLQWPEITAIGERLAHAMFGLAQPKVFHYDQVFNALLTQQPTSTIEKEDAGELLLLQAEMPRFSAEDRDRADAWLKRHFGVHRRTDIAAILELAEAEGLGDIVREYMTFVMYRAFAHEESPYPIDAHVDGRFENELVEGSRLIFTQREASTQPARSGGSEPAQQPAENKERGAHDA